MVLASAIRGLLRVDLPSGSPAIMTDHCEGSPIVRRPNVFWGRRKRTKMVEKMIGRWRAPRRLAGLVRVAWPRRGLVAEACLHLVLVETRLRLFPLKRQGMRDLAPAADSPSAEQLAGAGHIERQAALDVGWAVTRVAAYFPLSAMCLAQALAAREMLRRRGIGSIMHVGVARSEEAAFEAHAWLEAAGVEVTGYPVPPHLREIGSLLSDGARRR
jgi:Transglutaminase-like superfamily